MEYILTPILNAIKFLYNLIRNKLVYRIELVSQKINENSNWYRLDDGKHIYINKEDYSSPIFDFTFFNHYHNPVILKSIDLEVDTGIKNFSGPSITSSRVKPSTRYNFNINAYDHEIRNLELEDPFQISAQDSARLHFELRDKNNNRIDNVEIKFTFIFNDKKEVTSETMFLNTRKEKRLTTLE